MIQVNDLELTYRTAQGNVYAVRKISLEVSQGQFYTLLGPSGCGKTTTLRCVAGLERPDSGEIIVGDRPVFSLQDGAWVPPYSRNIGMVFQSYAIWPHMNVFDNVAFPLRHLDRRLKKSTIRERVLKALSLVHLDGLEKRPAPFLSGGQQQRLALARALVAEPLVLLLDEPLSNLDAKLREEMRLELRDLIKRLNMTTLYVTHEQLEALTMSDIIGVMKDGQIVQEGSPLEIYRKPAEQFVAEFIGKSNFLPARVRSRGRQEGIGLGQVETPIGPLNCYLETGIDIGDSVMVVVRPENVSLCQDKNPSDSNIVEGEVEVVSFLGDAFDCTLKVADHRIRLKLHPSAVPKSGEKVWISLPSESCLIIRN